MGEAHPGTTTRKFWKEASQLKLENTGSFAVNAKTKRRKKQQRTFFNHIKYFLVCGRAPGYEEFRMERKEDHEIEKYVNNKPEAAAIFSEKGKDGKNQFQPPEDALSYTLDEDTRKWEVESMTVRVARQHFAEGGMRKTYAGGIIMSDGRISPCVFKVFFKRVKPALLFDEVLTQVVSSTYAKAWNLYLSDCLSAHPKAASKLIIVFLPVSVVQFPERKAKGKGRGSFATMEPYLKYAKSYTKLNDNYGRHQKNRKATLAQAFSYFTFVKSKGYLMVCDIQGVERIFTDPQVHSIDTDIFGSGNLGVRGMNQFLANFQYSKLCTKLKLPHPSTLQQHFNTALIRSNNQLFEGMKKEVASSDIDIDKLEKETDAFDFEAAKKDIANFATTIRVNDPFPDLSMLKREEEKQREEVMGTFLDSEQEPTKSKESPLNKDIEAELYTPRRRPTVKEVEEDKKTAELFHTRALTALKNLVDRNKGKRSDSEAIDISLVNPYEIAAVTRRSTVAMSILDATIPQDMIDQMVAEIEMENEESKHESDDDDEEIVSVIDQDI